MCQLRCLDLWCVLLGPPPNPSCHLYLPGQEDGAGTAARRFWGANMKNLGSGGELSADTGWDTKLFSLWIAFFGGWSCRALTKHRKPLVLAGSSLWKLMPNTCKQLVGFRRQGHQTWMSFNWMDVKQS